MHAVQLKVPSEPDQVPATQLRHAALLVAAAKAEYVPIPHCAHVVAPVDDHDPAAQLVHADDEARPAVVEYVPLEQLMHTLLATAPTEDE